MKVITNKDINDLILFSKKNLGIYKLVYKEHKKIYWCIISFTCLSIVSLILYILLSINKIRTLEKICFFCCIILCFITLFLSHKLNEITKYKHLEIQDKRLKLLIKYYNDKNMHSKNILIINAQLAKRIEKIEKQKTTVLVILGILILPLWENFIQYFYNEFTSIKFIKLFLFSIIMSFVIAAVMKICNRGIYLYEENIYIKNNVHIIENLIYLNTYIINDEEERKKHGRRK